MPIVQTTIKPKRSRMQQENVMTEELLPAVSGASSEDWTETSEVLTATNT
jgi:hypothetical protein